MASKESLKIMTAGALVLAALAAAALLWEIRKPTSRRPIIIIRGFQQEGIMNKPYAWTMDAGGMGAFDCKSQDPPYVCTSSTPYLYVPYRPDGTPYCPPTNCTAMSATFVTNDGKRIEVEFANATVTIKSDVRLYVQANLILAYGDFSKQTIATKEWAAQANSGSTFAYQWVPRN